MTTNAIDYRQLVPALDRVLQAHRRYPAQVVADGDYTNHASVQAAAVRGVDFYGSWKPQWEPGERAAHGRSPAFQAQAFADDAAADRFTCPAGQFLPLHHIQKKEHEVLTDHYRAAPSICARCALRSQCAPATAKPDWVRTLSRTTESASVTAFKAKMDTAVAQAIYRLRSQRAEFPHAWIKQQCGLRQFHCRGQWKVACAALWACLSYNLSRWFAERRKQAGAVAA